MANPAQDEVDRLFNQRERITSHPEDRISSDQDSDSDDKAEASEPAFSSNPNDDTDEEDLSHNMSAMSTSKATYQLPTTPSYANTGPKGVIADAQNYARAKSSFRNTLAGFAKKMPWKSTSERPLDSNTTLAGSAHSVDQKKRDNGNNSDEDLDDDDDADDDFMNQWRQTRLAELQSQSHLSDQQRQHETAQRRISPSRRVYGVVHPVDAEGYLDAIEHSSPSTTVVVMLHDPESKRSCAVEDELDMLAYRYPHVRFVKMHWDIAAADGEWQYLEAPAVLGYRAGDVVGTISGATSSGPNDNESQSALEKELFRQGVLKK